MGFLWDFLHGIEYILYTNTYKQDTRNTVTLNVISDKVVINSTM
jgi:hypothetical protein